MASPATAAALVPAATRPSVPATSPGASEICVEACKEEVRRLLSRLGGEDNKIVQAADDLEDTFRKMGWLYQMQISPRQVGSPASDSAG